MGRVDVVPVDTLGIRSVLGEMLGVGRRLTSAEAASALVPFGAYRGLVAYYLLVAARLLALD